jgi:hypothetical protein
MRCTRNHSCLGLVARVGFVVSSLVLDSEEVLIMSVSLKGLKDDCKADRRGGTLR